MVSVLCRVSVRPTQGWFKVYFSVGLGFLSAWFTSILLRLVRGLFRLGLTYIWGWFRIYLGLVQGLFRISFGFI